MGRRLSRSYQSAHSIRMMASTAVVLLMLIAAVRLWPVTDGPRDDRTYRSDIETIHIDEVLQTAQARSKPPPPPPPVPIEAQRDFLLEEPDLDLDVSLPDVAEMPGLDEATGERTSGARVHEAARPVRFVEPEYTPEARRQRLRAEIVVQLLVTRDGRVEDTLILNRYVLADDADRRPVEEIGFGLEEAALAAARRWVFRPAREDGSPVESFYVVTFSFGV